MSIEIRAVDVDTRNKTWIRHYVIVDGIEWGSYEIEFGSRYGTKYHLHDSRGHRIGGANAAVRSSGRRGDPSTDPRTLQQRLLERAEAAIHCGDLRSPATLKEEAEAMKKRLEEERKRHEAEKNLAFEKKACELLEEDGFREPFPSWAVPLIVKAMKWSQTQ